MDSDFPDWVPIYKVKGQTFDGQWFSWLSLLNAWTINDITITSCCFLPEEYNIYQSGLLPSKFYGALTAKDVGAFKQMLWIAALVIASVCVVSCFMAFANSVLRFPSLFLLLSPSFLSSLPLCPFSLSPLSPLSLFPSQLSPTPSPNFFPLFLLLCPSLLLLSLSHCHPTFTLSHPTSRFSPLSSPSLYPSLPLPPLSFTCTSFLLPPSILPFLPPPLSFSLSLSLPSLPPPIQSARVEAPCWLACCMCVGEVLYLSFCTPATSWEQTITISTWPITG